MIQKLRGLGSLLLGLVSLAIVFGAIGLCQWGYGQARPHVPDPVRSIVGGEKEFEVDDYLRSVPRALERLRERREVCAETRDQPCLTRAIEQLKDEIGQAVPASASWMTDAHRRLYAAISEMVEVNRLSETLDTSLLLDRALEATEELADAAEEWLVQANR